MKITKKNTLLPGTFTINQYNSTSAPTVPVCPKLRDGIFSKHNAFSSQAALEAYSASTSLVGGVLMRHRTYNTGHCTYGQTQLLIEGS